VLRYLDVPEDDWTEAYARAVNAATKWREDVDLDRDTEVRMPRQERVAGGDRTCGSW
jgi:hypothetical protein